MAAEPAWEYRVQTLGTALRSARDEEIEALLNQWGEEGWELVGVTAESGKVRLLARRPLSRATRRWRSMPG